MNKENFEIMWEIMRENNMEIPDICIDYRCTICKTILKEACSAPCGCRYCKQCIKNYLQGEEKMCPGETIYCKMDLINFESNIQEDRPINIRISGLLVKCPNIGCQTQVEMKMMASHLRICERRPLSCPYFEFGCNDDKIVSDQLKDHLLTNMCSHTKLLINWMINSRNETESLKKDMKTLKADNDDLKEKIRIDGERTEKIIQDLNETEMKHLFEIETLKEEIAHVKSQNDCIKNELEVGKRRDTEQISKFEVQLENQNQEIEKLKVKVCTQTNEIRKINQLNQNTGTSFDEIRQTVQESQSKLKEMVLKSDSLQVKFLEIGESIQKTRIKSLDTSEILFDMQEIMNNTNYGEYLWKIENWSQKSRQARNRIKEEIISNDFYSHKNGYKMCLAVWPNGNGTNAKGTYLSLFFYILRGPYDDALQWPFNQNVELILIDQKTGLAHVSLTKYSNYPKSPALIKPTKSKTERNEFSRGFDNFISLQQLLNNPSLCQNNQLFIKCSVKPGHALNKK